MGKVAILNLEMGMPDSLTAVRRLKDGLMTEKYRGVKAVIVIHGYGSTGVGGALKAAVQKTLAEPQLQGLVAGYFSGTEWSWRKREALAVCKDLKDFERRLSGNEGVTVVILRSSGR